MSVGEARSLAKLERVVPESGPLSLPRAAAGVRIRAWQEDDLDRYAYWLRPHQDWYRWDAPYEPALTSEQLRRVNAHYADVVAHEGGWDWPQGAGQELGPQLRQKPRERPGQGHREQPGQEPGQQLRQDRRERPGQGHREQPGQGLGGLQGQAHDRAHDWGHDRAHGPAPVRRAVVADAESDQLMGTVSWYGRNQIFMGVSIYDPRLRGHGRGSQALSLWADYLFASSAAKYLCFATWSGNLAMIRVGKKLGFTPARHDQRRFIVNGRFYQSVVMTVAREQWCSV